MRQTRGSHAKLCGDQAGGLWPDGGAKAALARRFTGVA